MSYHPTGRRAGRRYSSPIATEPMGHLTVRLSTNTISKLRRLAERSGQVLSTLVRQELTALARRS